MNDSSRIMSFCTNEEINEKTLFVIRKSRKEVHEGEKCQQEKQKKQQQKNNKWWGL